MSDDYYVFHQDILGTWYFIPFSKFTEFHTLYQTKKQGLIENKFLSYQCGHPSTVMVHSRPQLTAKNTRIAELEALILYLGNLHSKDGKVALIDSSGLGPNNKSNPWNKFVQTYKKLKEDGGVD